LSNIVNLGFKHRCVNARAFSADVYTNNRKKFQIQIQAESVTDAYFRAVANAFHQGISMVRCVAIYEGSNSERFSGQAPVKIWQQAELAIAIQS